MSLIRRWAVRRQIQRSSHQALHTIPWPADVRPEEPLPASSAEPVRQPLPVMPTRAAATPDPGPALETVEPAPPPGPPERGLAEAADCPDLARDDELARQHPAPLPPATKASPDAQQPWELPQWRYRTRRARKSQRQHRK